MLEIFGAIFIIVVGTLFHFLYEWTHHNRIVGIFAAVNESTWEHLKLIVAPSFIWFIVESHVYGGNPNLSFAKFVSMFAMLVIVPVIFYAYLHFKKKDSLVVDIASFVFAVIVGQWIFHLIINLNYTRPVFEHIGTIGLIVIGFLYVTMTLMPDKTFLFRDPLTKKYGFKAHSHSHHKRKKK